MSNYNEIRVGVSTILFDPDSKKARILLGKRINKEGNNDGVWCLPGGHMEMWENFEQACKRETEEETGLIIDNVKKFDFINDPIPSISRHYITLYFTAKVIGGTLSVTEPDKMKCWGWFDLPVIGESLDGIPQPLFSNMENVLIQTARLHQIYMRQNTESLSKNLLTST